MLTSDYTFLYFASKPGMITPHDDVHDPSIYSDACMAADVSQDEEDNNITYRVLFLPRGALSCKARYCDRVCLSVCLSVCDVQVP